MGEIGANRNMSEKLGMKLAIQTVGLLNYFCSLFWGYLKKAIKMTSELVISEKKT